MLRRLLLLGCTLLTSGCLWPVRENTDATVAELAARALDPQPPSIMPRAVASSKKVGPADVALAALPTADAETSALMQGRPPTPQQRLQIPPAVPGSEAAGRIDLSGLTREQIEKKIRELYPPLPALPEAPRPQPGPGGKPYTLADLQRIASENSPALRQAVTDVEVARGSLIQAKTYTNPTVGFLQDPNNNNTAGGVGGGFIDQVVRTFGKQKLSVAAAQRDVRTAELNLRRARIDLATAVRTAYYGLLVADETMLVTRALAGFTDEIYKYQAELAIRGGFNAPLHEPAPLRAQAYAVRLAYKQAIVSYAYAWKQLVAALGLRQLPLVEVAGRIDRFVPRYEFDTVREQMLNRHTDIFLAQNAIEKARYVLKLAQVTPYPDIEFRYTVEKDTLAPRGMYHTLSVGGPLPIWDRNKGNIIAAQAALERSLEQPHTAEVTLVGNLSTAFTAYQSNLAALIYFRRHVLPDLVRYYVGILTRRGGDPAGTNFNDIVTAQQTLVTNVQTYLTTLGAFWTGVVQVAALLQTEDLFQFGKAEELPELPDLECVLKGLPRWACHHGSSAPPVSPLLPGVGPVPPPGAGCPTPPALAPGQLPLPTVLPEVVPAEVRPSSEAPLR